MIFLQDNGHLQSYKAALESVGLPYTTDAGSLPAGKCTGLFLPGGGDIYGALDAQEQNLINCFVKRKLPVLGICRGMQAVNVFFGGTLYDFVPNHQSAAGDLMHAVRTEWPLSGLPGLCTQVNSNHHQAVERPGRRIVPCQWAADGVVEAIVHRELPILGVQWHPERMGALGAPIFIWLKEAIDRERRA